MANSQRTLLAILLTTALHPPALANDTLATLGAGGLIPVASSAIAMESEDLVVSLD